MGNVREVIVRLGHKDGVRETRDWRYEKQKQNEIYRDPGI